jgi:predicted molibdopterin-dependent oxidoreductase YjgC
VPGAGEDADHRVTVGRAGEYLAYAVRAFGAWHVLVEFADDEQYRVFRLAVMKGRELCTLAVSPADAARLGLAAGGRARVTSRVGQVELTVEISDDILPGVVSIPHGWGHDLPGSQLSVAREHAGANTNLLTDDLRLDPLSGTAVLNGVPVEVEPVPAGAVPMSATVAGAGSAAG